jgi:serine/threonine protein kinase
VSGFSFCQVLPSDPQETASLPSPRALQIRRSGSQGSAWHCDITAMEHADEIAVWRSNSRSLRYLAPEVSRGLQNGTKDGPRETPARHWEWDVHADVYSFALIIWELFAGELPFAEHSDASSAAAEAAAGSRPSLGHGGIRRAGLAGVLPRAWTDSPAGRCTADRDEALSALRGVTASASADGVCMSTCAVA